MCWIAGRGFQAADGTRAFPVCIGGVKSAFIGTVDIDG
jgi:hypothetical protein